MDGATLMRAMGGGPLPLARYNALAAGANEALLRAQCTNLNRASMFLAQVGHETLGLRFTEEIASGEAYNGRRDLGNTQPGDGPRFKGRSFIQVTGRGNYQRLSQWAHGRGFVPNPNYFINNPTHLARDQFAWLGPVWFWTVERPRLNALSDARDLEGATRAINGGLVGLADRQRRWRICLALGNAIIPVARTAAGGAVANNANTRPRFFIPFPAGARTDLKSYRGHNPDDKKVDMYAAGWPNVVTSAPGRVHRLVAPGGCLVRHFVPGTRNPGNWYTLYLHMTNVVANGTVLGQGERVGVPGSVGTGARHLHYEQLHDRAGKGDAFTADMVRPAFVEHNNGQPFAMPVGEPGIRGVISQNRRGVAPAPSPTPPPAPPTGDTDMATPVQVGREKALVLQANQNVNIGWPNRLQDPGNAFSAGNARLNLRGAHFVSSFNCRVTGLPANGSFRTCIVWADTGGKDLFTGPWQEHHNPDGGDLMVVDTRTAQCAANRSIKVRVRASHPVTVASAQWRVTYWRW
jgi:predicted chitinase